MKLYFYCGLFLFILIFYGCAHVIPPSGGKKDISPPQILEVASSKNNEKYKLNILCDEFIVLNEWNKYFYISPPLNYNPLKKISKKTLSISIQDTLNESVNYYVCLNKCLKDLNEGNVLDSLYYFISQPNCLNNDTLFGLVTDAYNNLRIENAWVMLFKAEKHDSLILEEVFLSVLKTNLCLLQFQVHQLFFES